MCRPRVLLADDHPMMLEGLRKLLEPSCEVVGRVTDGRALLVNRVYGKMRTVNRVELALLAAQTGGAVM